MARKVRMLGMDPGYRNYGIAVTELDKQTRRITVLKSAVLEHPVQTFTEGYRSDIVMFLREIRLWIREYEPRAFIAERFQSRGIKGLSSELVPFMLGLLASHFGKLPHKLITASTWKNDVNRRLADEGTCLKELYKEVLVVPHQLDAVLMSIYGLRLASGIEVRYDWDKLINQVNKTGVKNG